MLITKQDMEHLFRDDWWLGIIVGVGTYCTKFLPAFIGEPFVHETTPILQYLALAFGVGIAGIKFAGAMWGAGVKVRNYIKRK